MKKKYEIVFDSEDDLVMMKPVFIIDKVLKTIKKSGKNGASNKEICDLLKLDNRGVRDATQKLKAKNKITVFYCRCGGTPIYKII
jgi:hypothetical protein|tara:strand:+ start:3067 stop:3321 length:255 start_codon:yes stop_codon:yes gene_type:complete